MTHIVILGAGLGGVPMAYEMRAKARPDDRITVVSNSPYFQFVPSNPWLAVGRRQPEDIKVALKEPLAAKGIEFIDVGANRVHPAENRIELNEGEDLRYDQLIIATGPELAWDEVPGLGPVTGYSQSICHVEHAARAAAAWDRFLEKPGPVVIGAVQGASCFGPAYEFAFIVDAELRKRRLRDRVPMTFVTSEPYIGHLGLGGVGDSKGLLESAMRQRHIRWICNAKVERVDEAKLDVIEHDERGDATGRREIAFDLAMLLPAFRGIDAIHGIEGLTNPRGFVLIDKLQRNPAFANVWAVGVCVAIAPVEATPIPTGVPRTGYMIESMVRAVALNVRAVLDGKTPSAEASWNAICLADMGDTGIAFVAMPEIPPRNVAWIAEGRWVHLAKVAFEKYFLRKVRRGATEPIYEKYVRDALGITKLKT